MELIDHRGHEMPYVAFPGGKLLLGTGPGEGLYLQNRWEDTYAHEGMEVYLNPHFRLGPNGTVEVERHDGRPSGMCFTKDSESNEYVPAQVKERLFVDLGARLQETLRSDPDLLAYLTREIARSDLAKAEEVLEHATSAFVEAAADVGRAKRRLEGGRHDTRTDGVSCFVVLALPEGFEVENRARYYAKAWTAASDLGKSAGLSEVPVVVHEG